ncbi:Rha family transcriptional regulator [Clostridium sp.]|uniref:Rha family transcriptional regulator n=1 Tax=Clostridium sp. TaxID=1506 RepID=UPI001EBAFE8F|nr:Rha family transcriptional regulator [Clostridium sp.]MBS5886540.1 ORF6C domain-containing protein [Clostridium sp.]
MNKIVNILNQEGQLVVTSRQISEDFKKRNSHVVEAIENKIKSLTAENSEVEIEKLFIPTTYIHNGNEYKEYLLTRDGFTFIVMGFTGAKADAWKLKYIEAFNKMEKAIKEQQVPKLSKELQAIFMIDGKQQELEQEITVVKDEVKDLKDNLPLLGVDCDEITSLIKKICTKVTGYQTPAYKDKSLRGRVYSDIYGQVKREFQVKSYKAIKRSQIELAKGIITNYKAPKALLDEIIQVNNQVDFEEVI